MKLKFIQETSKSTHSGLLTTKELASFLKFSERHMSNLVRSRRIPRMKIGHSVRFDPNAVLRALGKYEETAI